MLFIFLIAWEIPALRGITNPINNNYYENYRVLPPDTNLPFPFQDNTGNPYTPPNTSGLYLKPPKNINSGYVYDPETNKYIFTSKIGDLDYESPTYMDFDEFLEFDMEQSLQNYWTERSQASGMEGRSALIPKLHIGGEVFDRIFGSSAIEIRPQGSAELIFGIKANRRDDPALNVKQRKTENFDFQEKIQLNVVAKIGDKIEFGVNYNTEATFEFDNKMKLQYEGKEDEIIQLIEAGDVTLPLNGSLITGSQALFGIKTKLQFGKTTVTSVFSQQKSESSNITVSEGAQTTEFYVKADEYEENKHFFLAQYFRDHYNEALSKLPVITSPINITKIEVWLTNIGAATTENRNVVAFMDVGERDSIFNNLVINPNFSADKFPDNNANDLLTLYMDISQIRNINTVSTYLANAPYNFTSGVDFEKVENARKLSASEYTFNSKLGFISLNTRLNSDQVLAVAYQYTVIGTDSVYQVGEFSNGGISAPNCLVVKLLKSTALNTHIPLWKLMMKNVYSIGAYQVNPEDFRLNILYEDDKNGVPTGFITEGAISGLPLIRAMNLDNLNVMLDPVPDGVFDFIDGAATMGGTVQSTNGRIYFPVVEPFGLDLRKAIDPTNPYSILADKYAFDVLYSSTRSDALQHPDKNRFALEGIYKSSSGSEISLNAMNVPQGSVVVTAGGVVLTENVDYTVDYTLGRVKIINEGYLNSGTPINISLESNALFNVQTKTFLGTHIDYEVNKDFYLGATILNLSERPLTPKVNYGDEPISNTIWGLDGTYQTESIFLTKLVDKIPFIDTKVPSRITINGEFAQLIPGHSSAIGKTGTSYIDDFEGSSSSIDMKNIGNWFLSSAPQGQSSMFPETELDSIAYGFNRAKLAWYIIDPLFVRNNSATPDHIQKDVNQQSNHFVREILEQEVFPKKDPGNQPTNIAVLNLAFYPNERGPYNYDVGAGSFSRGLNVDGTLKDPETRWGGIMREIDQTDFESTNIEYIEFWMMDPFIYDPTHSGGELYFNLGDVSEDVLKDGRKSYENGLPTSTTIENVDTTIWGRVPKVQAIVQYFDNDSTSRQYQDVGLDGLRNKDEETFFDFNYIQRIASELGTGTQAYANAVNDPSGDDYHHFRGSDFDNDKTSILERYKMFNGLDGNSPTEKQSPESYTTSASERPNVEDINLDNTLSDVERYFQYRINLRPDKMNVGENFITDVYESTVTLKNKNTAKVKWYQFKIPVNSPDKVVGMINDFKSIRFMRIFMRNFSEPVVCRFATLNLVRGEWRKYNYSLLYPGEYIPNDEQSLTTFDITTVNIEENGNRTPVPYILPPDIEREINLGTTALTELNEQSLVLKVCNLQDGDARAGYKTTEFDFRRYKRIKMYVHAEEGDPINQPTGDGELTAFIRLGSDFTNNYYEYEIPLVFTPFGTSALDEYVIWPEENEIDLELKKIIDVKQERNVLMRQSGSTITLLSPYIKEDGNSRITVVGTPNLGSVKAIMIGVRNPKKRRINDNDDGLEKCAEIWVDEFRLTDFDESGGCAATARIAADLADFGNVIIAGSFSTPGFGSIEKKVNERQTEQITQYDIATNLQLGKFFPEKAGIKIPMHFDYSEMFSNPEFNPLNPDVKFKDDLDTYENKTQRDSIKKLSQEYVRRKSLNFVNVKKMKVGSEKKRRIYSIENFNFTYAYNEIFQRNIDIEYKLKKKYKGAIGYNFTVNPKNVKPFKKSKFFSKYKYLALIRDFNFYYLPKMISFRTDMDREYNEQLLRNKSNAIVILEPNYLKTFTWNRLYNFKYDLSQSLKIDYNATVNARIDEPPGKVDKNDSDYKAKRDTIWDNIMDFGRKTYYAQSLKVDYNIPINKIPFFNWVNASARYGSNYTWTAAPLSATDFGNTIENSNTKQLNANTNMISLYNKVGYLKKLNAEKRSKKGGRRGKENEMEIEEEADTLQAKKINYVKETVNNLLMIMMGVRNVSFSYTEGNGTLLPGFKSEPDIFGMNLSQQAPGWGFVFGLQDDIREQASKNGWITSNPDLNTAYATKHTKTLNVRSTIEPINNLRVELTARRSYSESHSEYYKADALGNFNSYSPMTNGSFGISWITWNTAFVKDADDYSSDNFEKFKDYLIIIANRLAEQNPNWNQKFVTDSVSGIAYPDGYSRTSQDVIIPAFIAAYTQSSPEDIDLSPFPKIPKPNWRITYTGLSQIRFLKKYFKSVTIGHAYNSSYNIGSFVTNILYEPDKDGFQYVKDELGNNYLPVYEINQISITEQFSPLINIDIVMQNSLSAKFEIKKSRNLGLSFANNQLIEVTSLEYVVGAGYRIKDVKFSIKPRRRGRGGGRTRNFNSDLSLKADFSIRNNKTVLRKLIEDVDQISAGQKVMSINFTADYMLSQRLNFRIFYDMVINNPFVSSSYPNSNTNAGISLRFILAQ